MAATQSTFNIFLSQNHYLCSLKFLFSDAILIVMMFAVVDVLLMRSHGEKEGILVEVEDHFCLQLYIDVYLIWVVVISTKNTTVVSITAIILTVVMLWDLFFC